MNQFSYTDHKDITLEVIVTSSASHSGLKCSILRIYTKPYGTDQCWAHALVYFYAINEFYASKGIQYTDYASFKDNQGNDWKIKGCKATHPPDDPGLNFCLEAEQQELSFEVTTLQTLSRSLPIQPKQIEAVNMLQSWVEDENSDDQRETGEYLIQALDEDRLSERKLFPLEMKGITW